MTFLLVFFTSIVGVISYYIWVWTYWKRRGIPGPMGIPFFGSALQLLNPSRPSFMKMGEWTKKYGKVFGMTEGLSKVLVISDPDLVQEVFVKQYDNFFGRKLNPIQGDPNKDKRVHLFAAQGHRWKRLRTISSPTFSNNSLRKLKNTVEESVVELMRHIETQTAGGNQIDMLTFYQEFTLDVIGRIAMGQTDTKMFNNPMLPYTKAIFGSKAKALIFLIGFVNPPLGRIIRKLMFAFPSVFPNAAVHILGCSESSSHFRGKIKIFATGGRAKGQTRDIAYVFW